MVKKKSYRAFKATPRPPTNKKTNKQIYFTKNFKYNGNISETYTQTIIPGRATNEPVEEDANERVRYIKNKAKINFYTFSQIIH